MHTLVGTQQVARAVGVSEATVKRWCDRGLIQTARTAGGHRRLAIRSVLAFIRETGRKLVAPASVGLPESVGRVSLTIEEAICQLRQVLVAGEEQRGRQILFDLYLDGLDLAVICDRVMVPAFACLGEQWKCGDLAVYQERRACELCLTLLSELGSVVPLPPANAPVAIGCTSPGDPYTLPTSMVQLSLREAGWRASTVGRGMAFHSMASAAASTRPQLFWLSVSTIDDVEEFIKSYEDFYDFARTNSVPVVVGGRALDAALRRRMRFTAFGDSLQHIQEFAKSIRSTSEVPQSET
jgi:methanogenic corrinoid protein MtbC1